MGFKEGEWGSSGDENVTNRFQLAVARMIHRLKPGKEVLREDIARLVAQKVGAKL